MSKTDETPTPPSPAEVAKAELMRKFELETERLTKVQAGKDALAKEAAQKTRAAELAARHYPNYAGKGKKQASK